MRLIVGTYRRRDYIEEALASIDRHVHGITDIVFVDDSGDTDHHTWLAQHGKVVDVGRRGYNAAMKAVCAAAEGEQILFWEEDFTAIRDIHVDQMAEILYLRPYLAQVALLRQPWFPIEHTYGGLIEALQAKGHTFTEVDGVLEQTATFTCNPSVWRASVTTDGWPAGKWSEDRKRDILLGQGYRFGYLPGIAVHHDGERRGFDY
ncbi:glycosyltransferase family 2 protein [Nocardia sp. NPDC004260]